METLGRTDGALINQSPDETNEEVMEVISGLIAFYPGVCAPYNGATAPVYQITYPVHKRYADHPNNVKFTLRARFQGLELTTPLDSPTVESLVGFREFETVIAPILTDTFVWPVGQPHQHHTVVTNHRTKSMALTYESLGLGPENKCLKFTTHRQANLVSFLELFLNINLQEAIEDYRIRKAQADEKRNARSVRARID